MAACTALSAASIAAASKAAVAFSRNEIAIDMAQSEKQCNQKNGAHNIICHTIPSKKIKKSETHQTANRPSSPQSSPHPLAAKRGCKSARQSICFLILMITYIIFIVNG